MSPVHSHHTHKLVFRSRLPAVVVTKIDPGRFFDTLCVLITVCRFIAFVTGHGGVEPLQAVGNQTDHCPQQQTAISRDCDGTTAMQVQSPIHNTYVQPVTGTHLKHTRVHAAPVLTQPRRLLNCRLSVKTAVRTIPIQTQSPVTSYRGITTSQSA